MLKASEELFSKYQKALSKAGIGLWELDVVSGQLKWDEGYRLLYEMDEGIYSGNLEEMMFRIHPEDRQGLHEYADSIVVDGPAKQFTFRILLKNNKIKYLGTSTYRVAKDATVTLVGLNWDVTTESLLQLDLIKEKKFSENILNAIPDPLFVKNEKHEVIYANSEYEKFVGMKKENFLGKDDYNFFPKDVADYFWERNAQVLASNKPEETNEQVMDAAGDVRDVLTKKTPVNMSPTEKILIGVIRDITQLKNMQTSLVEQSKMASLGEMAAGIAHEINNPLSIIQGKSQLLHEKINNNMFNGESYKKDLEQIEQNCLRIDKIIKSLKSVSRKTDQDPLEEVRLLKIIDEAFEISKERFRKRKLNLFVITDDEINYDSMVLVRPSEIVQVLVNLLNNSYDAIENQVMGWARIHVGLTNTMYLVEVTDSGNEIPPDVAQKMMDPFFTTKSTGKGTGLGLSISRKIIQNHGGDLFFDSLHINTKFVFNLPRK